MKIAVVAGCLLILVMLADLNLRDSKFFYQIILLNIFVFYLFYFQTCLVRIWILSNSLSFQLIVQVLPMLLLLGFDSKVLYGMICGIPSRRHGGQGILSLHS